MKLAQKQGFIRFEGQNRKRYSEISKGHFNFFYNPIHNTGNKEESILLDILFEDNSYHKIAHTPLITPFLNQTDKIQMVRTPFFEDLLGDKMTAFAPNTTEFRISKERIQEVKSLSNNYSMLVICLM
jgi:hypothetical protein